MKLPKKILSLAVCLMALIAYPQENAINNAKEKYEQRAYIEVAKIYLKVAESGYKSKELFQRLATSFYYNAKYKDAAKWYGELFDFTADVEPIHLLRYSRCLNAIDESKKSIEYYNKFLATSVLNDKTLAKSFDDYKELLKKNSNRFDLHPLNINSPEIEFGGTVYNDSIFIFSSTNVPLGMFRKTDKWNNMPFMNLFKARIIDDVTLDNVEELKGDVNRKYHETTPTFTKDGKTMYFTSSDKSKNGDSRKLKIYKATLVDGTWTNIEDLPKINSDEFSTSHPSLSADNTKLYFAANNPGGYGLIDLYVSEIDSLGNLGFPQNLGAHINTKGRESFPYISVNNELYFSSDGHFGIGGYDVFYVDLNEPTNKQRVINIGAPLNSNFDDVAFSFNPTTKKGYVSSNRNSDEGYDDIFSFKELKPIEKEVCSIYGIVTDETTGVALKDVTVTITNAENQSITLQTDVDGAYRTTLKCGEVFTIRGEKTTYYPQEGVVKIITKESTYDFSLKKEEKMPIDTNLDIAPILNIDYIYFDYDKYDIRQDAEVELQKVIALMQTYPKVRLNVKSHTDSRATQTYNKTLSEKRAESTIAYIIKNGIDASRITGKGYGETQLINRCADDVECTEEEHQQNRRSEFIIVNY